MAANNNTPDSDIKAKPAPSWFHPWTGVLASIVLMSYFVPLFHVVSLSETQQKNSATEFDAAQYANTFWQGPLLAASQDAVDATALLQALNENTTEAAERYGHRLGLSSKSSYLVSGEGIITAIENYQIHIALAEDTAPNIIIDTGPVFGNAIRDGSGLLNVGDFSNTQEFNAVSAAINMRVENEILPYLEANAVSGKTVWFAGGVELAQSSKAPETLTLVPIKVEFP
jgi:predicted lipoprotein